MKIYIVLLLLLCLCISCLPSEGNNGNTDIGVYSISSFVGNEHFALRQIDTGFGASYFELKSWYVAANSSHLNFFDKEFNLKFKIKTYRDNDDPYYSDQYYWDTEENLYILQNRKTFNGDSHHVEKFTASSNYTEAKIVPYIGYNLNLLLRDDIHKQKLDSISTSTTSNPDKQVEAIEAYKMNTYIAFFEDSLQFNTIIGYMSTDDPNQVFLFFNDKRIILTNFGIDIKELIKERYSTNDLKNTKLTELPFEQAKDEISFLRPFQGETTGYRTIGPNSFSFEATPPFGYIFYNLIGKEDTTLIYSYESPIYVLNENKKILFNQGDIYQLERCPE